MNGRTVTLTVDSESRALYDEALRRIQHRDVSREFAATGHGGLAIQGMVRFVVENRPPTPRQKRIAAMEVEGRDRAALAEGRRTLTAIRTHLRENGMDDPQRAVWREAQRRHRAVSRG